MLLWDHLLLQWHSISRSEKGEGFHGHADPDLSWHIFHCRWSCQSWRQSGQRGKKSATPPPQIIISKATKLRNKIKGMTVIWCHWKCFAKCSSKDDTVMVSHCAFICHNAFYSSYRLSDALLDNLAILSSGSDNLSDMKADVSVFCHFDLRELMPWKLMRILHVKSIYCGFFPPSAFPGELAGGGGRWETCVIKSEAWQSIKAVISSQDSYGFNKLFMLHSCSLLHHRGPSAKLQP